MSLSSIANGDVTVGFQRKNANLRRNVRLIARNPGQANIERSTAGRSRRPRPTTFQAKGGATHAPSCSSCSHAAQPLGGSAATREQGVLVVTSPQQIVHLVSSWPPTAPPWPSPASAGAQTAPPCGRNNTQSTSGSATSVVDSARVRKLPGRHARLLKSSPFRRVKQPTDVHHGGEGGSVYQGRNGFIFRVQGRTGAWQRSRPRRACA